MNVAVKKNSKKKPLGVINLLIPANSAKPAPPIGPALGQRGLNIMDFCNQFNAATKDKTGPLPVLITYYQDKTFTFVVKNPPASYLIKNAIGLTSGSSEAGKKFVGKITVSKLRDLVKIKFSEMSAANEDAAIKTFMGTCTSMGIEVEDDENLFSSNKTESEN